jgi:hypothetical protein
VVMERMDARTQSPMHVLGKAQVHFTYCIGQS